MCVARSRKVSSVRKLGQCLLLALLLEVSFSSCFSSLSFVYCDVVGFGVGKNPVFDGEQLPLSEKLFSNFFQTRPSSQKLPFEKSPSKKLVFLRQTSLNKNFFEKNFL